MTQKFDRRDFLRGTAQAMAVTAIPVAAIATTAHATGRSNTAAGGARDSAIRNSMPDMEGTYLYEVTRTEAEWRALLDDGEYLILRQGSTEPPRTTDLWNRHDRGTYHCRGCDLRIYDSEWKVRLNIGWNFFRHSVPGSTLTGIDGPVEAYGQMGGPDNMIEVHCRRCASHLGHIVRVGQDPLHCINGTSLTFRGWHI